MENKQTVPKTVKISGSTVPKSQRPQSSKEVRSKSTTSLPKKPVGDSKVARIVRKAKSKSRVELLSVPDDKMQQLQVRVERTSSVQMAQIPFFAPTTTNKPAALPLMQTNDCDLSEPQLQSSLAVLEVLNRMKSLNFDNDKLLRKVLRDNKETRHQIEKKAARATNIDPQTTVFRNLEPLDVKDVELVEAEEKRQRQLACHITPTFPPREDEPKLSEFAQPYRVPLKPLVPYIGNFGEELTKFGLNPLEPVTDRIKQDDLFVFRMMNV